MKRKDIKVRINMKLWEKVKERIILYFGKAYSEVDCLLIISLLYLYKHPKYDPDTIYLVAENPSDLSEKNYKSKTICVFTYIMNRLKKYCSKCTNSQIIEWVIVSYLHHDINFYTDCITPLYTFIGSKNITMQSTTASSIDLMNLDYKNTTLIDGCAGTGSLFLGLNTYNWKAVVLNDKEPHRTNFLNVVKKKGVEFVKYFLNNDIWTLDIKKDKEKDTPERLNYVKEFQAEINTYKTERETFHKIGCNLEIAFKTLLLESWGGAYIDDEDNIFNRILKILPACLKLQNATITQEDCLKYLENNDSNKLIILDVPYIGTEKQCGIKNYDYVKFHKKVAQKLHHAQYSFLYFCRSSAPKSEIKDKDEFKQQMKLELAEKIMKMKLGEFFCNKGFYFEKILLNDDVTELIISNQLYDSKKQFKWINFDTDIRN